MCMQVVNFEDLKAVNEWIEEAANMARRAYEAQEDWRATRLAVATLIHDTFPKVFKDDESEQFICWVDFSPITSWSGVVDKEVEAFTVLAVLQKYDGDRVVKKHAFNISCLKDILTDTEKQKQWLNKFRDKMAEGGF